MERRFVNFTAKHLLSFQYRGNHSNCCERFQMCVCVCVGKNWARSWFTVRDRLWFISFVSSREVGVRVHRIGPASCSRPPTVLGFKKTVWDDGFCLLFHKCNRIISFQRRDQTKRAQAGSCWQSFRRSMSYFCTWKLKFHLLFRV